MLSEDISSHVHEILEWLRGLGFELDTLEIGSWIKSRGKDEPYPKSGHYAYRCWQNQLRNGLPWLLVHARVGDKCFECRTKAINQPREGPDTCFFFPASPFSTTSAPKEQTQEELDRINGMWAMCAESGPSPYLDSRSVKAYGLRFFVSKRSACVPVRDQCGSLRGLQFLNSDGSKRFLPGSRVIGCFHQIGTPGERLILAEGYATGAFLHELTGVPVCVCFMASNLVPVSQAYRKPNPQLHLIIASDNDRHLESNEGLIVAENAAKAVGGSVLVPDFGDCPAGQSASDWLDLARIRGVEHTKQQLREQWMRTGSSSSNRD